MRINVQFTNVRGGLCEISSINPIGITFSEDFAADLHAVKEITSHWLPYFSTWKHVNTMDRTRMQSPASIASEVSWPKNFHSFCDLEPTKGAPGNRSRASSTKYMATWNYCPIDFSTQTDTTNPCCLRCIGFFRSIIGFFLQFGSITSPFINRNIKTSLTTEAHPVKYTCDPWGISIKKLILTSPQGQNARGSKSWSIWG